MSFQQKGTVKFISKERQVTDTFKVRDLYLTFMDGKYEQTCHFQFVQNNCGLLNSFSEGDEVMVTFDLRGRVVKKDGKTNVYNTIQGWKIEKVEGSGSNPSDTDDMDPLPF